MELHILKSTVDAILDRFLILGRMEQKLIWFQANFDKLWACLILSLVEIAKLETIYKKIKLLLATNLASDPSHLGQLSRK